MSITQIQPQNKAAGVFVPTDMLSIHYSIDCDGRRRNMHSCYLAVYSSEAKNQNLIISLLFFSRRYEIQMVSSEPSTIYIFIHTPSVFAAV